MNLPNSKNRLYSVQEAAEYLGVSSQTLRRWESRGILIPQRTKGNQRRYSYGQLQRFKVRREAVKENPTVVPLPVQHPVIQKQEIVGPFAVEALQIATHHPPPEREAGQEDEADSSEDGTVEVKAPTSSLYQSITKVIKIPSFALPKSGLFGTKEGFFSRARVNIYKAGILGFCLLILLALLSFLPLGKLSLFQSFEKTPAVTGGNVSDVLASQDLTDFTFVVNLPSRFTKNVKMTEGLDVDKLATLSGGLVTNNQNGDFGTGIVIASNIPTVIITSVADGNGIAVDFTNPARPSISNTGVLSLQGSTGAINFSAGSGISLSGLTINNSGVTSLQGSTGAVTLTAGSGIAISGTIISATAGSSQWTTNGTSIYYNTGNVGIGTTAPSQLFEISGGTGIVAQFSGRVIGGDAVNPNEFATLSQISTSQYWQRNAGTVSPANISDDVLIGGISTATAKFAFINNASGTPTALINGNLLLTTAGSIQTSASQTLTLGGSTTGDILLAPQNGALGAVVGPNTNNQVDLGTASLTFRTIYAGTDIKVGGISVCLLSGTNCPSGSVNYWNQINGTIYPGNSSVDFLLGGTATAGAKFAVLNMNSGSPVASLSATTSGLALDASGSLQSLRNGRLTIGGSTTGNITLAPLNGVAGSSVAPNTNNQVDLGTASLAFRNIYAGTDIQVGGVSVCLATGTNCPAGSVNYWNQLNGTLYPGNSSLDLLVGGTSSSSAKFAFINVNSGSPTASIAGNIVLNSAGNIQTTQNRTLTIGGNSTGQIVLSGSNGSGSGVTFSGYTTGILQSNGSGVITSAAVNLAGGSSIVTGTLPVGNGGTGATSFTANGILYGNGSSALQVSAAGTNGTVLKGNTGGAPSFGQVDLTTDVSGVLPIANGGTNAGAIGSAGSLAYSTGTAFAFSSAGSNGQCLISGGNGAPTWTDCGGAAGDDWNLLSGALYPKNTTLDLLIGGASTVSAKFAFINNNSGTPTASIAGNVVLAGGSRSIQSTAGNTLTIGGLTTGQVVISGRNGSSTGITFSGYDAGVLQPDANGVISSAALNLAGGSSYITGTLPVGNGGTGATSFTTNGILYGNNTSAIAVTGAAANAVLVTNGSNVPSLSQTLPNAVQDNITRLGTIASGVWNGTAIGSAYGGTGQDFSGATGVVYVSSGSFATEAQLAIARGGTNTNSVGSAGSLAYSTGTAYAFSAVGITGQCLISGGTGAPTWTDCGGAAGDDWTLLNGVLYPKNSTVDLLIGGNSTTSAKFAFINNNSGTPTASIAGNIVLNSAGSLQTTSFQTLTIGGSTTGQVVLSGRNGSSTGITLSGYSTGLIQADANGILSSAALNLAGGSSYVTGVLPIANGGTNGSATPTAGAVAYGTGTAYAFSSAGSTGQCLISGGSGAPTWTDCGAASGDDWDLVSGVLYPKNATVDMLIGGTSTISAKFAFINVNSGIPTASISGNVILAGGARTIQGTAGNALIIGGSTTGQVVLSGRNGNATGITFAGYTAGVLQPDANGVISSAALNLAGGSSYVTGTLPVGNGGTGATSFTTNGILYGNNTGAIQVTGAAANAVLITNGSNVPSLSTTLPNAVQDNITRLGTITSGVWNGTVIGSQYGGTGQDFSGATGVPFITSGTWSTEAQLAIARGGTNANTIGSAGSVAYSTGTAYAFTGVGSTGQVLTSNGSSTPTWTDAAGLGTNYWNQVNGAISPKIATVDLLIGGISTASAKFAFINNNSGTPTASIAGNIVLNSVGSLQTTAGQTLTVGGNTTGQVVLSGRNGSSTGVTFSGYGIGLVQSDANGVLSSAALNLAGGSNYVTGVLPIANGGTNGSATPTAGAVAYGTGTAYAFSSAGSTGQCLLSGGNGAPTWSDCSAASGDDWDLFNGALYPKNSTVDLLIGGTSTASAKFAFINNNSGIPTASIAGNIVLNSAGTLQTTANQTLTIGGSTTGNIVLTPRNGSGTVAISSLTSGVVYNTNGVLAAEAQLAITRGGTNASSIGSAGSVAYSTGTAYAFSAVGNTGQILQSNGSSAPSWVDASSINFWQRALGALSPLNISDDLLLGGTSTASALVRFGGTINANSYFNSGGNLGIGTDTPGAKLHVIGTEIRLTGDNGSVALQLLDGGSSDQGTINLRSGGTTNTVISADNTVPTYFNAGNVGVGITAPLAKFDVNGNASISGNLTFAGGARAIQGSAGNTLTIGGSTTGQVVLSGRNGNAAGITFSGYGLGVLQPDASGVISSAALNLAGGSSYVTGLLPIANGGTNGSATPTAGAVAYGTGTAYAFTSAGNAGQVLVSNGSGAPTWTDAGGVGTNYWDQSNGALSPKSLSADLLLGGNSTVSAKFAFINNGSGTPTASISANSGNNATFLTGLGVLGTTNGQTLSLGNSSTGQVLVSGRNGSSTGITFLGYGIGVLQPDSSGILSSAALNLAGGSSYVTGTLPIGNGGTNSTAAPTAGAIAYGTGTAYAFSAAGTSGQCLISGGTGSPTWSDCGAASGDDWDLVSGALYPKNSTVDLLVGGTATSSAKFAVLGMNTGSTPVASLSATTTGLALNASGSIQSLRMGTLTIGGSTTGNIEFKPGNASVATMTLLGNGNIGVGTTTPGAALDVAGNILVNNGGIIDTRAAGTLTIGGTTQTGLTLGRSGQTTKIANLTTNGVVYTSGGDGTLNSEANLAIARGGTNTASIGSAGSVAYSTGTAYAFSAVGASGQCLISGGTGSPIWTDCGGAAGDDWNIANGAIYPKISTLDLLIGGTSTVSAKFAFINVNSGTPTASIAGNIVLNSAGSLQTTAGQTLTFGGSTTGNIVLAPGNGSGTVAISSLATGVVFNTNGVLSSEAQLAITRGGTNTNSIGSAGSVAYSNGTSYAFSGVGIAGQVLVSNGSGTPAWQDAGGVGINYWNQIDGALSPKSLSADLLLGGNSTTSAKFAFINNASGTPTASISGNIVLNSAGSLQTTANQTLTFGGNTSGNIVLAPLNGIAGATVGPNTNNQVDLGTASFAFRNIYAGTDIRVGGVSVCLANGTNCPAGAVSFWNQTNGALYPISNTVDMLFGSSSTASAKFGFVNVNSGTPTASISANSGNNATFLTGLGILGTTNGQTLSLGGSTTGQVVLSGRNASSTGITFAGYGTGVLQPDANGVISSAALNLAGGASYITGTLPVGNGGTGATSFTTNGILYGNNTSAIQVTGAAANAVLITNGSNVPSLSQTLPNAVQDNITRLGTILSGVWNGTAIGSQYGGTGQDFSGATGVPYISSGTWATEAQLAIARGGTNANTIGSAGSVAYSTGTAYAFSGVGGSGQCLISGGNGAPTWSDCSAASGDDWDLVSGALYPKNSTVDLLIGGTSTDSAKFAVLNMNSGTPVASLSATTTGLALNAGGTIQSLRMGTLTIGGSTTGDILLSPRNGSGQVLQANIGANTAPAYSFSSDPDTGLYSSGTNTLNVTAGGSEVARFTSSLKFLMAGTGTAAAPNVARTADTDTGYFWPTTDVIAISTGGSERFRVDATGNVGIGTTSPAHVLQVTGIAGNNAAFAVNNGNATSDIFTASSSGTTRFTIANNGTITASAYSTGVAQFNSSGVLSSAALNLAGGSSFITGLLPIANGGTNGSATPTSGAVAYGTGTAYAFTGAGNTNQCLISNGSSAPSWADCALGATTNYWNSANGTLYPINSTVDLFVGGQSSASAKFAVLNMNSGTPVASLSATTTGLTMSANGTLQSIRMGTLTLGGSTTGNIVLTPGNGSGTVAISGLTTGVVINTNGVLSSEAQLAVARGGTGATTFTTNGILYGNGSSAIQVTGAAANAVLVTNGSNVPSLATTLPNAVQDNITRLGTIVSGVWNGTVIGSQYGGTGQDFSGATGVPYITSGTWATEAQLAIARGGTNSTASPTQGGVAYGTGTAYAFTSAGNAGQVLISNGTSAPSWADSGTIGTNYWDQINGALYPKNSTVDLLIGAQSTASAKFAFINVNSGTPTASVSSGLNGTAAYLTAAGALQTAKMGTLTIGGATTGNIVLDSGSGAITLADATTVSGALTANGLVTAAAGLTVNSGQNLTLAGITGNNAVLYGTSGSGIVTAATTNSTNLCLVSGASAPSWGTCPGGTGSNWTVANGVITPNNSTLDLTLGGQSTASAKFAVLGMNTGSTPVASLSATTTGLALNAGGSIQSLRMGTLTLGGSTTGNIEFKPGAVATATMTLLGNGNVGIGTTAPGAALDVAGNILVNNAGSIDTRAAGTLSIGGTTQTGLILGRSGQSTRIANLTTDGVVFTSGTNGTLNSEAQLAIARGGTNSTATPTQGGIAYGTGTAYAFSLAGTANQCLISGGTGSPTWADCALGASTNYWNSANGTLYPINSTVDLLVGGQATTSAKFAVLNVNSGTPVASISATATGNGISIAGDGSIQSLRRNTLILGGSTTGNIQFAPSGTTTMSLVSGNVGIGTTTPNAELHVTRPLTFGATGKALAIFDQIESQDIFTASASGTTRFTIANNGTLTASAYSTGVAQFNSSGVLSSSALNLAGGASFVTGQLPINNGGTNTNSIGSAGSVAYSNGTAYAFTGVGSSGQCLTSGGSGTPTWAECATGANFWTAANGTLYSSNTTQDLLIGGTATSSADFAFINVNSGTPTASISGNLAIASPLGANPANSFTSLDGGSLNFLTSVGGDTGATSRLFIKNDGNIGIGTTTPLALLDIAGNASASGNLTLYGGARSIQATANNPLTIGGNTTGDITFADSITLTSGNNLTLAGLTNNGGLLYTNGSGVVAQTAVGSGGQCLQSAGGGSPIWGSCGGGNVQWDLINGAIAPSYASTVDLLIGGQSTASAKFAVLNMNSGTPVASLSATTTGLALSADGSIQSLRRGTLTIGGSTTGNIQLVPGNTTAMTLLSNGNVGIGTTSPVARLDVSSGGAGVTAGDLVVDTANKTVWIGRLSSTGGDNTLFKFRNRVGDEFLSFDTVGGGTNFLMNNPESFMGIGTTSPQGTVHIASAANNKGAVIISGDGNQALLTASASGSTKFLVDKTGNVGIGTTAPNQKLTIVDSSDVNARISVGDSFLSGIFFDDNQGASVTDGNWFYFDGTLDKYLFTGRKSSSSKNIMTFNNVSGNVGFGTISPNASLYVTRPLSFGANGKALAIFDQIENQDIFTASASGTTRFSITNAGGIKLGTSEGSNGQCLLSGGTNAAASWGSCAAGVNFWNSALGTLYPGNSTLDLLIGGTATASAKFAVLNMNSGTPVASLSATTTGLTLNAGGNIQSLRNGNLTLGGNTTGAIQFAPNNTTTMTLTNGNVGIGTTSPTRPLHISANAPDSTNGTIAYMTGNLTSTANSQIGLFADININVGGASSNTYTGLQGAIYAGESGTNLQNASMIGLRGSAYFDGIGDTYGEVKGGDYKVTLAANSTINSAYGLMINDATNTGGTINSLYGLAITGQTTGVDTVGLAIGESTGTDDDVNLLIGTLTVPNADYSIYNASAKQNYFAGNLGIGTTTPLALLDIAGNASASGNLTLYGGARSIQGTAMNSLTLGGNTTGNIFVNPRNGTSGGIFGPGVDNVTSLGASATARFRDLFVGPSSLHIQCTTGDGCGQGIDWSIGTPTSGATRNQLQIGLNRSSFTTGTPAMIFTQEGNVGIGRTSTFTKLDVDGDLTLRGVATNNFANILFGTFTTLSSTLDTGIFGIQSIGGLRILNGSGQLVLLQTTNAGNIGIGTATPTSSLYVTRPLSFGATGKALAVFDQIENQDIFTASASGTTRFVIQNNGNVGIGTTSPLARFDVQAANITTSATTPGLANIMSNSTQAIDRGGSLTLGGFTDNGATTLGIFGSIEGRKGNGVSGDAFGYLAFKTNNNSTLSERMRIDSSGNVGIGTTAPESRLHVAQTMTDTSGFLSMALNQLTANPGGTSTATTIAQWNRSLTGSGTTQDIAEIDGIYNEVVHQGQSGSVLSLAIANNSNLKLTNTGTITAGYGNFINTQVNAAGTITEAYGLYVNEPALSGGGAITTMIGAQVATLANATNNTHLVLGDTIPSGNYGIYNSSTYDNYFAGDLGIGTTAPIARFQVDGRITGKALTILNEMGNQDIFTASASGATRFIIKNDGNVGIGTMRTAASQAAQFRLQVVDTKTATAAAMIYNDAVNNDADGLIIKLGTPTSGFSTAANCNNNGACNEFITFQDGFGRKVGKIAAINTTGTSLIQYKTSGNDFAELFDKQNPNEDFPEGTLVCLGNDQKIVKCSSASAVIVGVRSDRAGFIGGEDGPNAVIVGLLGRIPVFVNQENGLIKKGDAIGISSEAGIGAKAIKPGMIIGRALEDAVPGQQVMALVSPIYFDPDIYITDLGNVNVFKDPSDPAGMRYVVKKGSHTIDRKGVFSDVVSGVLKAGVVYGDKIMVGDQNIMDLISQAAGANGSPNGSGMTATEAAQMSVIQNEVKDLKDASLNAQHDIGVAQNDIETLQQMQAQIASETAFLRDILANGGGSVLGASDAASLDIANLDIAGNAIIGDDLTVLGRSTLNDLGVTGSLTAGIISLDGLKGEINTVGEPLKIQSLAAAPVDFMDGKVVIETTGNLVTKGTITTKGIAIDTKDTDAPTLGEGTIKAGETTVTIETAAITSNSRIFVTPREPVGISVSEKDQGVGFTVKIQQSAANDIDFDWFVVEEKR